jgi:hypothetical protein
MHFSQSGGSIRKELQALLAEHDIKRAISKRQIQRTAFLPTLLANPRLQQQNSRLQAWVH